MVNYNPSVIGGFNTYTEDKPKDFSDEEKRELANAASLNKPDVTVPSMMTVPGQDNLTSFITRDEQNQERLVGKPSREESQSVETDRLFANVSDMVSRPDLYNDDEHSAALHELNRRFAIVDDGLVKFTEKFGGEGVTSAALLKNYWNHIGRINEILSSPMTNDAKEDAVYDVIGDMFTPRSLEKADADMSNLDRSGKAEYAEKWLVENGHQDTVTKLKGMIDDGFGVKDEEKTAWFNSLSDEEKANVGGMWNPDTVAKVKHARSMDSHLLLKYGPGNKNYRKYEFDKGSPEARYDEILNRQEKWIREERVINEMAARQSYDRMFSNAMKIVPFLNDAQRQMVSEAASGRDLERYRGVLKLMDKQSRDLMMSVMSAVRPVNEAGFIDSFAQGAKQMASASGNIIADYYYHCFLDATDQRKHDAETKFDRDFDQTLGWDKLKDPSGYWEKAISGYGQSMPLQTTAIGGALLARGAAAVPHPAAKAALGVGAFALEGFGLLSMAGDQYENLLLHGVPKDKAIGLALAGGTMDWIIENANIETWLGGGLKPQELMRLGGISSIKAATKIAKSYGKNGWAEFGRTLSTNAGYAFKVTVTESLEELAQGMNATGVLNYAEGKNLAEAFLDSDTFREGAKSFVDALPACTMFGITGAVLPAGSMFGLNQNGTRKAAFAEMDKVLEDVLDQKVKDLGLQVKGDQFVKEWKAAERVKMQNKASQAIRSMNDNGGSVKPWIAANTSGMTPTERAYFTDMAELYTAAKTQVGSAAANAYADGNLQLFRYEMGGAKFDTDKKTGKVTAVTYRDDYGNDITFKINDMTGERIDRSKLDNEVIIDFIEEWNDMIDAGKIKDKKFSTDIAGMDAAENARLTKEVESRINGFYSKTTNSITLTAGTNANAGTLAHESSHGLLINALENALKKEEGYSRSALNRIRESVKAGMTRMTPGNEKDGYVGEKLGFDEATAQNVERAARASIAGESVEDLFETIDLGAAVKNIGGILKSIFTLGKSKSVHIPVFRTANATEINPIQLVNELINKALPIALAKEKIRQRDNAQGEKTQEQKDSAANAVALRQKKIDAKIAARREEAERKAAELKAKEDALKAQAEEELKRKHEELVKSAMEVKERNRVEAEFKKMWDERIAIVEDQRKAAEAVANYEQWKNDEAHKEEVRKAQDELMQKVLGEIAEEEKYENAQKAAQEAAQARRVQEEQLIAQEAENAILAAEEAKSAKMLENRKTATKNPPRLGHAKNQDGETAQRSRSAYLGVWKAKMGQVITQDEVDQLAEVYGLPPEALNLKRCKGGYKLSDNQLLSDDALNRLADGLIKFYSDIKSVKIIVPDVIVGSAEEAANAVPNEVYDPVTDTFVTGRVVVDAANAKTLREQAGLEEPTVSPEEIEAEQNREYKFSIGTENDDAYENAVMSGDVEAAQRLLKDAANKAGYTDDVAYRISHHAPTNDGYNKSLDDIKEMFGTDDRSELLAMSYGRRSAIQAVDSIISAKGNPNALIDVYRAVPKSVKDTNLRRGDWVALSEEYARNHGESWLDGKYNIIHEKVRAGDLYTDGNMIEEAGFDDGKERVYSDTKNGTKLLMPTFDDNGNLIPLSKRFNRRVRDTRFSINGTEHRAVWMHDTNDRDYTGRILDGTKKGETRNRLGDIIPGEWMGLASDINGFREIRGKAMFGSPIWITKNSPEYKDAMIEGDSMFDIDDSIGGKWYYPVIDKQEFPTPITEMWANSPRGTMTKFSIRHEEPPKKTGIGYKVFVQKNGKLYPPMVANPDGAGTPIGVWLNADEGQRAPDSKTGRQKVKAGGKGTNGGGGTLAWRPGWHLGNIPYALQFNVGEKVPNPLGIKNKKGEVIEVGRYFPSNFVWAEVEYADDVDYQEEAMSYGYTPSGAFNHALAGLPRLPVNGSYSYRTNANPATDPWIITGAMRVNKILTADEVDDIVSAAGRIPQEREDRESNNYKFSLVGGEDYVSKFGNVLSGDSVRSMLPGFDPIDYKTHIDKSGYVGGVMQKTFDYLLANRKDKGDGTVVFLAGGNGAGKSTIASKTEMADFVVDSTLGNIDVARAQIDAVLANGQTPHIMFVYRKPEEALGGIEKRVSEGGHIVSPVSFANSHTKSLENLSLLAREYNGKIRINVFNNSAEGLTDSSLEELEALPKADYEYIRKQANETVDRLRSQGALRGGERGDLGSAEEVSSSVAKSVRDQFEDLPGDGKDAEGRTKFSIATYRDGGRETLVNWMFGEESGKKIDAMDNKQFKVWMKLHTEYSLLKGAAKTKFRKEHPEYVRLDEKKSAVGKGELDPVQARQILEETDRIYNAASELSKTKEFAHFSKWSDVTVEVDKDGKPIFGVIRPNGDYAYNVDFSTVCKKRRPLDHIFASLVEDGTITDSNIDLLLSEENIPKIQDIIKSFGLEVACALCFVDSKRYKIGGVAKDFSSMWNGIIDMRESDPKRYNAAIELAHKRRDDESFVEYSPDDKETKHRKPTFYDRAVMLIDEDPTARQKVDASWLISGSGMDEFARKFASIHNLYRSFGGVSKAKDAHADVAWNNDIIRPFAHYLNPKSSMSTVTREKAYSVGGVRLQSFSDFVPALFFDYAQMFAEMAAKHLPMHTYTKEVDFVKIFGQTNDKINMSLVPGGNGIKWMTEEEGAKQELIAVWGKDSKPVKKNGKVAFYDMSDECFPPDFALGNKSKGIESLRDKAGNIGTIMVGVTDEHILLCLDDPRIDMVIPYHSSSLNPIVKAARGIDKYDDYTDYQRTGKPKEDADFAFYDALKKSKDPRKAAAEYVAWCKSKNYTPKFSDSKNHTNFSTHQNYYKLLADFRLYDANGKYSPQSDIVAKYPSNLTEILREALTHDQTDQDNLDKFTAPIKDRVRAEVFKMERELNAAKNVAKSNKPGKRSNQFSIGYNDANEIAALVGALDILQNGKTSDRNLDAIRKSLRANINIPDLRLAAERAAAEQKSILNYVASDKVRDRLIARAGMADRHQKAIDRSRRADLAFATGTQKKIDAINRANERVIRDTTGITAETILLDYGISPDALLKAMRPAERAKSSEGSTAEGTSTVENTPDIPHALDPIQMKIAGDTASAAFIKARDLAAKAKAKQADKPIETEDKNTKSSTGNISTEEAADIAVGEMMQNAIVKAISESGITLDTPAEMVKLVEAVTEQYIADNADRYQGIDLTDMWSDPRSIALLCGNIARFAEMAAEAYSPSFARERVAKKCQMLNDQSIRNLDKVEEIGVHIFEDLNRDIVRQSRKELMKEIHSKIDNLAKRHTENQLNKDRKVSSECSEWLKFVKRAIDMTPDQVEERIAQIEELLVANYGSTADKPENERFRDYHFAKLEHAVLTDYGNLKDRMPSEILAARDFIIQTVDEDVFSMMEGSAAFEAEAEKQIVAIIGGIEANPKNNGEKPEELEAFYSIVGMIEAKARQMTRFQKDPAKRKASLDAFANLEELIQTADDTSFNFNEKFRGQLTKLMESAYGSIAKARNALHEQIDGQDWFFKGDQPKVQLTVGRALQMYVSIIQSNDYADNCEKWGRDAAYRKQLESLLGLDTPGSQHLKFIDGLRRIYFDIGTELDAVLYKTTGTHLHTPGANYMPVVMSRRNNRAKTAEARAYSPFAPALTPRIKNGLDFKQDEDIVDVFLDRLDQTAHTIGWADRGTFVMRCLQSDRVINAINDKFGDKAASSWNNYILDIVAGPSRKSSTSEERMMRGVMRYASRLWLGNNIASWAKQLASVPCLALSNEVEQKDVARSISMWAMHPIQMWRVARDLASTDAFIARYGTAISNELKYATSDDNAFGTWTSKYTNAIMSGVQFFDKLGVLLCAGVYFHRRAELENQGKTKEEASDLASRWLMHIADKTMQSGRTVNSTELQRKGGLDALMQFKSSPMQQLQFEIVACQEWAADKGNLEKAKKMMSVIFINHIAVPMLMTTVESLVACLTSWGIPDEEKRKRILRHLIEQIFAGPFGSIFLIGAFLEYGCDVAAGLISGDESKYGPGIGQLVPAESAIEFLVNNAEKMADASMEVTNGDIGNAAIEMAMAIGNATPGVSWPLRQIKKTVETVNEDPREKEKRERNREIRKRNKERKNR